MMTSIFRLELPEHFSGMATREMGNVALCEMLKALDEVETLELDFAHQEPTPSFADQAVGNLAKKLGFDEFRRRVKLLNLPESARPLLRHVIAKGAALGGGPAKG